MTVRYLTAAAGWLFLFQAGTMAAVVLPDDVTVRVYDAAQAGTRVTNTALAVASGALAAANVGVEWRRCAADSRHCDEPTARRAIVLRLVNGSQVLPAAAANRAAATDPAAALRSRRGLPLGDAMVDPHARAGVLATIYVDRVMLLAEKADMDVGTLLGYAIAHELGHLLLASNTHAMRGIMRAVWRAEDLRERDPADWTFTAQEASAMRRVLDGDGGSARRRAGAR